MNNDPANRRRYPRHPIKLPCRYLVEGLMANGVVNNVSTGGCRVSSFAPLKPLSYLAIDMECGIDDCLLSIDLAVVRWNSGQEFGMEFIRMDPLQQERLQLLVEFVELGQRIKMNLAEGLPGGYSDNP